MNQQPNLHCCSNTMLTEGRLLCYFSLYDRVSLRCLLFHCSFWPSLRFNCKRWQRAWQPVQAMNVKTPAKAARPQTRGRRGDNAPFYIQAFAYTKLYCLLTEATSARGKNLPNFHAVAFWLGVKRTRDNIKNTFLYSWRGAMAAWRPTKNWLRCHSMLKCKLISQWSWLAPIWYGATCVLNSSPPSDTSLERNITQFYTNTSYSYLHKYQQTILIAIQAYVTGTMSAMTTKSDASVF